MAETETEQQGHLWEYPEPGTTVRAYPIGDSGSGGVFLHRYMAHGRSIMTIRGFSISWAEANHLQADLRRICVEAGLTVREAIPPQ